MYQGKHVKQNKRKSRSKKPAVLLVSMILLVSVAVGGTLAWLTTNTGAVTNTFTPAEVSSYVQENFNNGVKKNVKIQNTGNIDAYIRAEIIVTWKDAEGNVYGKLPVKDVDYEMEMGLTDWTQKDGYYYYNKAVAPGGTTSVLIQECKVVAGKAPDGYDLSVEIIADAIQSKPDNVVKDMWGFTPAG